MRFGITSFTPVPRALSAIALALSTSAAWGQPCVPAFSTDHGAYELDGPVNAIQAFDDGSGTALYFGGEFSRAWDSRTTSATINSQGIIRFDGTHYSPVGSGIGSTSVKCLTTFDDGTGPKLVAGTMGGFPRYVSTWDGHQWTRLGGGFNFDVNALAVWDEDGAGPGSAHLYAAGSFSRYGAAVVRGLARWNGTDWEAAGQGLEMSAGSTNPAAGSALAVFDDGSGEALYVGGSFDLAGGLPAPALAKWTGSEWRSVGSGVLNSTTGARGDVLALLAHGTGPSRSLYVGGSFQYANAPVEPIRDFARWDGVRFSRVGPTSPPVCAIGAIVAFDDGQGERLTVGGRGGCTLDYTYASFNGQAWTGFHYLGGICRTMHTSNLGLGARLFVGGDGNAASQPGSRYVSSWDGQRFEAIGIGIGGVRSIATSDDPRLPGLYVSGDFQRWSPAPSTLARRVPGGWVGVGPKLDLTPTSISFHDDGSGPAIYAMGPFTSSLAGDTLLGLARWNGTAWSNVGNASLASSNLCGFAAWDADGPGPSRRDLLLYGPISLTVPGQPTINTLARWNGATWSNLGLASGGTVTGVQGLNDGRGEALFASTSDALPVINGPANPIQFVGRWNGTAWEPTLPSNLTGNAYALAVFDDGFGPALYAAGVIYGAGTTGPGVYRWQNNQWQRVGLVSGDYLTWRFVVADDGGGAGLYLFGDYSNINGRSLRSPAFYRSGTWWAFGGGWNVTPNSFASVAVDEEAMYFAGGFANLNLWNATRPLGYVSSNGFAEWRFCPRNPCPADLDDGSGSGTRDGGVTIDDLIYFLDQYQAGTQAADLDNGSGRGVRDGGVTIDDLVYFLGRYSDGC